MLCALFVSRAAGSCPEGYHRCFDQALVKLLYAHRILRVPVGVRIRPMRANVVGGHARGFSVTPQLPAGLVLDPNSGTLSGTPQHPVSARPYSFMAFNTGGVVQTSLTLAVNPTLAPTPAPTPQPTPAPMTAKPASAALVRCHGCFGLVGPCISTTTLLGLVGARLCTDWSAPQTCQRGFAPCKARPTTPGPTVTATTLPPLRPRPNSTAHSDYSQAPSDASLAVACQRCAFDAKPCISLTRTSVCHSGVGSSKKCPEGFRQCHSCPTMQLAGAAAVRVKRGQLYVDAGCRARDSTGKDVSSGVVVSGNDVNALIHDDLNGLCTRMQLVPRVPGADETGEYAAKDMGQTLKAWALPGGGEQRLVFAKVGCQDSARVLCPKLHFDGHRAEWVVAKGTSVQMVARSQASTPDRVARGLWQVALDPSNSETTFQSAPMVHAVCAAAAKMVYGAVAGRHTIVYRAADAAGGLGCAPLTRVVTVH